ncbi:hypothetical protein C4K22_2135 [Pseudomonas chlororaphis subsp. aurantiaca]|uniref:hypothetical protein n=1 Tax=Pseudomonas chlororaphis TaxID=587753 RepID=UPI000F589B4B|nr:hypothetical protein [Pseudomonas chlororaphis]AZD34888.1 hypothetical protein C4K22_2135 [Pseudomonas chlororaphis subsp. aurantiaca]AZD41223.1 hypothetical protein C4K21_2139 [Pseudomonas chlororaphis subsp. aurantiaca]
MGLSILKDLPALHATLIGLGGSLFGVYALFSTERNYEAEKQKDLDLKELEKITEFVQVWPARESYFKSKGDLDWDVIWRVRRQWSMASDEQTLIEALFDFLSMINSLVLRYRFSDTAITKGLDGGDKGSTQLLSCDINHCASFMSFLESMKIYIQNNHSELLTAARKCDSYKAHCLMAEDAEFRNSVEKGEAPKPRKHYDGRFNLLDVNYAQSVCEAVEFINIYFMLVPKLHDSLGKCESGSKRFPLKRYSFVVLVSAMMIVFAGIVLPLLLVSLSEQNLDLCKGHGLCWSVWYEYLILAFTFLPYIVFMWFLLSKTKRIKVEA